MLVVKLGSTYNLMFLQFSLILKDNQKEIKELTYNIQLQTNSDKQEVEIKRYKTQIDGKYYSCF